MINPKIFCSDDDLIERALDECDDIRLATLSDEIVCDETPELDWPCKWNGERYVCH